MDSLVNNVHCTDRLMQCENNLSLCVMYNSVKCFNIFFSSVGCVMDSPHRLHPGHTTPAESDAIAAAEDSNKACDSCLEPLSQIEKPHPVHPDHDLYYITPTSPWKCDACKRDSANIQEIQCYHCQQCGFYVCKSCFAGVNSQVHHNHTLFRTDVRFIYSNGKWECDVCHRNNGPGHL